jgi:DnaJ-class molecular chaperone
MTPPQEFLEAFFREKAEVYADANTRLEPLLVRYFGEPLSQRTQGFLLSDRQVVDEVFRSGSSAKVTTRARYPTADLRQRFHLTAVGESWKIVRIDRQCFYCQGTGRQRNEVCRQCRGEGWCDTYQKNVS